MNASLVRTISVTNSSQYKVIKTENKKAWNYYITKSCAFDFYHTHDYHMMDAQGDPFLFVYEQADLFIAIPLIKRVIEGTPYFDCTSVYGYTGPLSNINFADLSSQVREDFIVAFNDYLLSQNIVSVFCVLHPLSDQHLLLEKTSSLVHIGKTVVVDLRQSLDEQRLQYRRPIRMKINQLRRKGFEIKLADSKEQLTQFAAIYRENMIKVGASPRYLFEDQYFYDFVAATDYKAELLGAYYEDRMVAGALVALTNNIMQLHLAGTCNSIMRESPMKLVYDEACLLGRTRGMHFMHLGSGIGGREDSLFHFKQGFSDCSSNFTTWRYIVNNEVYDKLVSGKLLGNTMPDTDMFPLYRFL